MYLRTTQVFGKDKIVPLGDIVDLPNGMTIGLSNRAVVEPYRVGQVVLRANGLEVNFSPPIVVPYGICIDVEVSTRPDCPIETPTPPTNVVVSYDIKQKRVDPCQP